MTSTICITDSAGHIRSFDFEAIRYKDDRLEIFGPSFVLIASFYFPEVTLFHVL